MGIHRSIPVAGEMLAAAHDPGGLQPPQKRRAEGGSRFRVRAEGTGADHGVVRVAEHIQHRAGIHVDPHGPHGLAHPPANDPGVFRVPRGSQGHGAGSEPGDMPQTGNAASFLPRQNEGRNARFALDQLGQTGA